MCQNLVIEESRSYNLSNSSSKKSFLQSVKL